MCQSASTFPRLAHARSEACSIRSDDVSASQRIEIASLTTRAGIPLRGGPHFFDSLTPKPMRGAYFSIAAGAGMMFQVIMARGSSRLAMTSRLALPLTHT
jgi:hypothetical protein